MQRRERGHTRLRRADLQARAIDWIELPSLHDRYYTRLQLDMCELARCTPLALNAPNTLPIKRVPTIVDHDILPDMGSMTAQ